MKECVRPHFQRKKNTTHNGEFVTYFEMFEENLGEPKNFFVQLPKILVSWR